MKKIGEENTTNGMFLNNIKILYYILIVFGFSACMSINKSIDNNENNLLRYFIQVDEPNFNVITSYKIMKAENIKLNHFEDFNVISVKPTSNGTEIQISRKSNKKVQFLNISFYDNDNILRNVQINFFTKIINLDQLEIGQKVIFDKTTDLVPPLFVMSSLQTGEFTVCKDGTTIYNFELLKELYFFCLRANSGEYSIGEKTCQNVYFNLLIK